MCWSVNTARIELLDSAARLPLSGLFLISSRSIQQSATMGNKHGKQYFDSSSCIRVVCSNVCSGVW